MHLIELAWRSFRRECAHNLQDITAFRSVWERGAGRTIPSPIVIPWMAAYAYIERLPGAEATPIDRKGSFADALAFFSAYRKTKRVYRFEDRLIEALEHCKWPEALPCEAIQLPANGIVLDLPFTVIKGLRGQVPANGRLIVGCYYDLRSGHEMESGQEIRIVVLNNEPGIEGLTSIDQTLPSLQAALGQNDERLKRVYEKNKGNLARKDIWEAEYNRLQSNPDCHDIPHIYTILTALLYLTGQEDVVEAVNNDRPQKTSKNPIKAQRFSDLAEPKVFRVGGEFVSTLDRWEREEREAAEKTGRTVRPHLRAAHSHLYWTGEGRKTARVRFIMPIQVKGGTVDKTGEATVASTIVAK